MAFLVLIFFIFYNFYISEFNETTFMSWINKKVLKLCPKIKNECYNKRTILTQIWVKESK